jgi:hypothetical protein
MGRVCSTYGGGTRCLQDFGGKTGWKKDHLEDLGIDGRIKYRGSLRNRLRGLCIVSMCLRKRKSGGLM